MSMQRVTSEERRAAPRSHRAVPLAWVAASLALAAPAAVHAQGTPPAGGMLARRYREGETIRYRMEATNQDRERLIRYSAQADAVVRRDSAGRFVEEFTWSQLVRNDTAVALPASGPRVAQRLTLAPEYMVPLDVHQIDPRLIGPFLDLLTFYVDLWIAAKPGLARPGDHARIPGNGSNSWADGTRLVLAEDAIDFDITLTRVDTAAGTALVTVRHVPPAETRVHLPAPWMREPIGDTPNNWVEVTNAGGGVWIGSVGRETFDVELTVSLTDGRIITATMDNPVDVRERRCTDAALTACGDPVRYRILRRIAVR